MANKTLFKSLIGKLIPATDAINEERAPAYALSPRAQLAQYAATGCLNTTFYAGADEQLAKVLELCADLDAEFIAKTAVYRISRCFRNSRQLTHDLDSGLTGVTYSERVYCGTHILLFPQSNSAGVQANNFSIDCPLLLPFF